MDPLKRQAMTKQTKRKDINERAEREHSQRNGRKRCLRCNYQYEAQPKTFKHKAEDKLSTSLGPKCASAAWVIKQLSEGWKFFFESAQVPGRVKGE